MSRQDCMPEVLHFDPTRPPRRGVLARQGEVLKVDRAAFLDLLQCSLRAFEVMDRDGIYQHSTGELCEALDPFQDYFDAARGGDEDDSEAITAPREVGYGPDQDPIGGRILTDIGNTLHAFFIGLAAGAILMGAAMTYLPDLDFPRQRATTQEVPDASNH